MNELNKTKADISYKAIASQALKDFQADKISFADVNKINRGR